MTLAIVWALALVVAWPALPWLELAVTRSPAEVSISDWVPSAEAQGKRRRRAKSRRKSRRSGAQRQAPSEEAPAAKPAPGARPAAAAAEPAPAPGKGGEKAQVFDFTGLDLAGQLRTPQLLYFLDRAAEELQRASLERRSFLPEMVRSIDEESL
jgi:hypothetical protein